MSVVPDPANGLSSRPPAGTTSTTDVLACPDMFPPGGLRPILGRRRARG